MYDIDRPKLLFISLLEDFIRETEHSLAFFFALLVFLLTFLLTLFGREALYTGLIGVLCLFLIKLRDIIEGFREFPSYFSKEAIKPSFFTLKEKKNLYTSFDDASLIAMTDDFPLKFSEKKMSSTVEKNDLLTYLNTCWKIIETISVFFPDHPLQPETCRAIQKMTVAAQKYLLHFLEKNHSLTKEQKNFIEKACSSRDTDAFLLQTQLEAAGLNENSAQWTAKIIDLLNRIRNFIDLRNGLRQENDSSSTAAAPVAPPRDQKPS